MSLGHAIILATGTFLFGVFAGIRLALPVVVDRMRMRGAFDEKKWMDARREEQKP